MDEYRHKISVGKQDTESGFIRLFVAICLVMVGFFIAFWLMQSVHQRMSSSSPDGSFAHRVGSSDSVRGGVCLRTDKEGRFEGPGREERLTERF